MRCFIFQSLSIFVIFMFNPIFANLNNFHSKKPSPLYEFNINYDKNFTQNEEEEEEEEEFEGTESRGMGGNFGSYY